MLGRPSLLWNEVKTGRKDGQLSEQTKWIMENAKLKQQERNSRFQRARREGKKSCVGHGLKEGEGLSDEQGKKKEFRQARSGRSRSGWGIDRPDWKIN